jgi:hypothetical protein
LDTPAEVEFNALRQLATYIYGSPIALITFLNEEHFWFKSKQDLITDHIPASVSFCRLTIRADEFFEVPDKYPMHWRTNGSGIVHWK